MFQKYTPLFPCNFTRARSKRLVFLTILALTTSGQVLAQSNDWWFDIEVVIFKRNIEVDTMAEQFAHTPPRFAANNALDLLSDYVQPNLDYLNAGLNECVTPEELEQSEDPITELPLENSVFQVTSRPVEIAQDTDDSGLDLPAPQDGQADESTPSSMTPFNKIVDWHLPAHLPCVYAQERVLLRGPYDYPITSPQPKRVPAEIDAVEWPERLSPYLLPKSSARLDAIIARIAGQRDLSPILHLTWRQPVVFGRSKALPMKLIAGPNYAEEFSQSGWRQSPKQTKPNDLISLVSGQEPNTPVSMAPRDLFKEIAFALEDTTPIQVEELVTPAAQVGVKEKAIFVQSFAPPLEKPLWQLEGGMKIYLQNVGRTPYLHIDSDLDFRVPISLEHQEGASETQSDFLQTYRFNQLRRVISKQLHYFDHPLFGMVVQIRRYQHPAPAENQIN